MTFIALPIFTTECPRRHTSTKEDDIHPVRALLQSRYRLESTKRRDREQVITKTSPTTHTKKDHVVHVPQIWALIINKYTIITCAPLDISVLRGKTIKLMSNSDAQLDEATWSVHFTDAYSHNFYLPLRFCKTWFGLVKQIAEDCLHDDYGLVRDQLLRNGPLYKLVANDNVPVTAESWVQMVEKERTEVIRLRLVDNETLSNRLLITYCDQDGNEMDYDSDASSDTSSVFTPDEDGSDTTESSTLSLPNFGRIAPAVDKLRELQAKLQEARDKDDLKKVELLNDRLIPLLEDQILELTAEDLGLQTTPGEQAQKQTKMIVPSFYERRRGSAHQLFGSPIGPSDEENHVPRSSLRARSGSRTRSKAYVPEHSGLYRAGKEYSRSAYDISRSRPRLRESLSQSHVGKNETLSSGISRSRHVFDEYSFPPRSNTRSRPQSLKIQPQSLSAGSRWDTVRSRVVNGGSLSNFGTPVSPTNDIYYKPSDKQLARSRWEFLRTQILAGADLGQSPGKGGEKEEREPISPRVRDKVATAMKAFVGDNDSLASRRASETTDLQASHRGNLKDKEKPKISFDKLGHEAKPKLKRLINLARKESASLPKLETLSTRTEKPAPPVVKETQDMPIFLWSTAHKPADIDQLARIPHSVPASGGAPAIDADIPEKPREPTIATTKVDEFYLYTILSGMHNHLKKPKKVSPKFADLYEGTVDKAVTDLVAIMATLKETKNQESNADEHVGNVSPTFVPSKIKFEDTPNVFTRLHDLRSAIFEVAGKILYAFVPEGYDAPVVSKYWGALHAILRQEVRIMLLSRASLC